MKKLFTAGLIAVVGLFALSGTAAADVATSTHGTLSQTIIAAPTIMASPASVAGAGLINSAARANVLVRKGLPRLVTKQKEDLISKKKSSSLILELPAAYGQDYTAIQLFNCPIFFIENGKNSTVAIQSSCLEEAMEASLSYASTAEENTGSIQVYIRTAGSQEMIALQKVSTVNEVYPQFQKQQTQNGDVYVFTFSNEKITSATVEIVSLEEAAKILPTKSSDSFRIVTPGVR